MRKELGKEHLTEWEFGSNSEAKRRETGSEGEAGELHSKANELPAVFFSSSCPVIRMTSDLPQLSVPDSTFCRRLPCRRATNSLSLSSKWAKHENAQTHTEETVIRIREGKGAYGAQIDSNNSKGWQTIQIEARNRKRRLQSPQTIDSRSCILFLFRHTEPSSCVVRFLLPPHWFLFFQLLSVHVTT